MPNRTIEAETDNERRYLALLALTSQELPRQLQFTGADGAATHSLSEHAPEESVQALYERLDADPAALESFIQREMERIKRALRRKVTVSFATRYTVWLRESLRQPAYYVAALGVVALVSLFAIQISHRSILDSVEQAFAGQSDTDASQLILPWEQPHDALGFAAAGGNDSLDSVAFAKGLLRGREKRAAADNGRGATEGDKSPRTYFALGEWNALLWSAARAEQPKAVAFWRGQVDLAGQFAAATYADEDAAVITAHLANVKRLLDRIAREENSRRTQRMLADELLLFRERFAPHDSEVFKVR